VSDYTLTVALAQIMYREELRVRPRELAAAGYVELPQPEGDAEALAGTRTPSASTGCTTKKN
jgi:hypothetical protein